MRYYKQDFLKTADGAELWYSLSGEGEPALVACDGLGCDGFAWRHLSRLLAPTHRILRWHYRGHGRSSLGDASLVTIPSFTDDLARIMGAAGMERAVIMGHSMGVQVALEFHRRHPARTLGLVPLCGAYGNALDTVHDDNKLKALIPHLRALAERFPELAQGLTSALLPTEVSYQYALWMEVNRRLVRREDFEPYFVHLSHMDPRVFLKTLQAAADHTAWPHLPHIDVPTLIVAADHDRFTPLWLSERMHRAIPDSEMLVVPAGTHAAPIEQPELIALRITRFIQERLAPRRAA